LYVDFYKEKYGVGTSHVQKGIQNSEQNKTRK
jgi:hypothetical protein